MPTGQALPVGAGDPVLHSDRGADPKPPPFLQAPQRPSTRSYQGHVCTETVVSLLPSCFPLTHDLGGRTSSQLVLLQ